MIGAIRSGYHWIADVPHQRQGIRVLQAAVGVMLMFRVSTEARFYQYLWGPSGVASGSTVFVAGPRLAHVLDAPFATEAGTAAVLLLLAAGSLGLVFGVATRLATLVTLVMFFLLEQRLPQLPDGGDNITRIVLVYLLFVLPPRKVPRPGSLWIWLHNMAVLAIVVQICILYEVSGFMKAYGDKWHHGIAMYYVSNVEWFSLPFARDMFKNPLIVTVATYVPMFYQLWFPMAMLSRVKLPWLAVGLFFHTGVALLMGLVSFSIAMMGLELFLIADSEYASLAARVRVPNLVIRLRRGFAESLPGTL